HAFNQVPMLGAFGIDEPRILYPGDPTRSVLMYRLSKTGSGHMPKIGSERVDDRGVALINQWIAGMTEGSATPAKAKAEQDAALLALQSGEAGLTSDEALAKLLSSTSGALALAGALENNTIPQPLRQGVIARGMSSPLPAVRDLFIHFS